MQVFLRIFSQLKENLKSFEKRLMWVRFLMNEGKNLTFFFLNSILMENEVFEI